jgi:hypothetical protein
MVHFESWLGSDSDSMFTVIFWHDSNDSRQKMTKIQIRKVDSELKNVSRLKRIALRQSIQGTVYITAYDHGG